MVEGYVVLWYSMGYCTILVFYIEMRFELDYNNNLYWLWCVDDILHIYHSDPWWYVPKEYNKTLQ